MANEIQLNAGIRSNLLLLQNVSVNLQKTQLRLSTGNKVNSALDGPAQFFASKGLNQRAGDLNGLKDGIGQAISTIKAADTGITSIADLVEQARGLTTQALGSLGNDANSVSLRSNLATQYNNVLRQIDRLATDAGYQGKNLLIGSGLQVDATASSKTAVNALAGISGARATNVVSADTYKIEVTGDGTISGSTTDVVAAEKARGISNLDISGFSSTTNANFDSISIKLTGGKGKDKTFTITEGTETVTQTFTTVEAQIANDNGAVLRLSHSFASGTKVSFDVNFQDIEDVPDTAGVGSSVIEKNVNLQAKVTNQNGEVVIRDGLSLLGQGKIADGENAFAFDSGSARITIDERQILQSSKYSSGVSRSYGTGAGAVTGTPTQAATISIDDTITLKATGISFNYDTNNFAGFSVSVEGLSGTNATLSVGQTSVYTAASVGANSAAISINLNFNELKYLASAAQATATEANSTLSVTAGSGLSLGVVDVSTIGSFTDNAVTGVNITVTNATSTSATFQYTDAFGGTASITVTLSGNSLAANTSISFNVTGGANSGAVLNLSIAANTVISEGDTLTLKARGEFTASREAKFDLRKANAGSSASLATKQVVDGTDANNLAVQLNENNTSNVTVVSQNVRTDGQGLRLDFAQNNFSDRADIDNAIKQLDAAKLSLRAASSALSTNLNIIQTRESYTQEFSNVLVEGANKLVQADQNEEGANVLTLQTRQQLGTISLSLANQAQQAILRLF